MKIIAGSSNQILAQNVAAFCNLPLTAISIKRFEDSEIFVEILEDVRGQDVFIIQSTSNPTNDHLMELLIIIDALKRGSARRITACVPYFGYGRQDRKFGPRTPITAKLVADLITTAGAGRLLTLDLHAGQIQGFFNIPVDNLYATPLFTRHIKENFSIVSKDLMVVSPDVGGVLRARSLAKQLNCGLAIIDKRRDQPGKSDVIHLIGDVNNKHCLIIDDIADSAGTLCNTAVVLQQENAASINAYVTHGVFSGNAIDLIEASPLEKIVVTDSIQMKEKAKKCKKITQIPLAPLFGEVIHRINCEKSVSFLFE